MTGLDRELERTSGCWTACARRSPTTTARWRRLADRSRHQGRARGVRACRRHAGRTSARSSPASMAQASFDALLLPRHIGLYAGVPIESPGATWCSGSAAPASRVHHAGGRRHRRSSDIELALCVGTESMSRNPVAAYTHRGGFRHGRRSSSRISCGRRCSTRPPARPWATPRRTSRAIPDHAAGGRRLRRHRASSARSRRRRAGFLTGEIAPVRNERFERQGYQPRGSSCAATKELATDTHVRPSPLEALASIRPAFGGVQTGGNSSAIVDGAAAALVASSDYAKKRGKARAGAHRGGRHRRRAARDHGHRPGAGDPGGAGARRPQAGGYRPLRDQRGLRRAGDGVRARARPRRGQAQRQWRRHRHRPSARRHRRAARHHAGARARAARGCATASPPPASAAARASRC